MRTYKRLDPNRPLTLNELAQKISFFKKKDWMKLLENILAKQPELTEEAMYMNKVVTFYSPRAIERMVEMSTEFKEAKMAHEKEEQENSPGAKLQRLLNT